MPPSSQTNLRRRRRGGLPSSRSSRRLSTIAPVDLINDVTFHAVDEFTRRSTAPERRHSIASLGALLPRRGGVGGRLASSERGGALSKDEAAALIDQWKENQVVAEGNKDQLKRKDSGLPELDHISEGEDESALEGQEEKAVEAKWREGLLVTGLFFGYVFASAALEKLNNIRPGCGISINVLQYLATVGEKSRRAREYISKPVLPIYYHLSFVFLMFLSVKMANASLGAGLPFGLYLVIKNTNLIFSLLLGLAMGQSYTSSQMISIATVTAGVSACVMAQQEMAGDTDKVVYKNKEEPVMEGGIDDGWMFGAALCAASTFCMAALGSAQEYAFARYGGKEGRDEAGESLFLTHLLGLPLFMVGGGIGTMMGHATVLLETPAVSAALVVANIGCTIVVKECLVSLLEEGSSLTATLAITVARMFGVVTSEIISAARGGEATPPQFWLGAALVVAGSLCYALGDRIWRFSKA